MFLFFVFVSAKNLNRKWEPYTPEAGKPYQVEIPRVYMKIPELTFAEDEVDIFTDKLERYLTGYWESSLFRVR